MKASGYDPVFTLLQHTVINLQCSSAVFRFYVKFALALNSHMYVNEVPQPRLKAVYDPNNEFTISYKILQIILTPMTSYVGKYL